MKTIKDSKYHVLVFTILFIGMHLQIYGFAQDLSIKTATAFPIKYYISLPRNWTPDQKWPVVMVLEEAEKQFELNAQRFVRARKDMPFIIICPLITSNGNYGLRDARIYPYSNATWDTIEKLSTCLFDMNGIMTIIKDVEHQYNGTSKMYITGFEAGTHILWAMVFEHPEMLFAAAPVAGNFRHRCIEENQISKSTGIRTIPIRNFIGENDSLFGKNKKLYSQFQDAEKLARQAGFLDISEKIIPSKGHVPLPSEVLSYFDGLWKILRRE